MAEAAIPSPVINPVSAAYRRYALWVLLIIYTLNFLDRQIIGILAEQCWSLPQQRPSFEALVKKFQNMPHDLNIAQRAKLGTWWPF